MEKVIASLVKGFQQDQDLTELPESEAFEAFAAYCVLSSYYNDPFNPDAYRIGGGNDLGIDAYAVLIDGDLYRDPTEVRAAMERRRPQVQVVIIQAKTSGRFETKVLSDLADNLGHLCGADRIPYDVSADVVGLRACLDVVFGDSARLAGQLPQLHVHYVTTGDQISDMVHRKARSAEKHLNRLNRFGTTSVRCVNWRELRALYQQATSTVRVTLPVPKQFAVPPAPGVEQSFVGLLAAPELVHTILDDGSGNLRENLFESNVRAFQGYNRVNSGIRDTLRDPEKKQRFAVMNNGITIVTRKLDRVGDDFVLDDFQIVNGCQTCHVLFHERDELNDQVFVSIHIVHSVDENAIQGIVAATNQQTPVSDEDLAAREDFHKELEDYFTLGRDNPHKLFYERRAKQYGERKDVEKTRVISRAQLSRAYLAMFLDEPSRVGHYQELIKARGTELFVAGQPTILYYTAAATWYRLEWMIRNQRISRGYRPVQYHLMAMIRQKLVGSGKPPLNGKAAQKECDRILRVIWDAEVAEKLVVRDLLPVVQRAIDAEKAAGVPLGEAVRNERFANRVRRELANSVGR
ncbi:AIPR family protein [Amycolatopsis magusensis]|uniref:AIPR family protein n=1 Tax=Amycolatopsis magusensis TaxID=882444 RepID=UPI0024A9E256|nr:AIPR family protein [Amycolatopsis magusensis]MDI5974637.1 AIPR family protein [Amycolatopsis magusensis]